jgi:steroid delta-isomerase-like uncharacterized protein
VLCVGCCPQAKEGTVSLDANKALLRRIPEEVWSKGDLAVADVILSPDFVNHNPAFGHPPTRDGYKQTVAQFREAFPDLCMTVEDSLAEGDKATVRFRAQGTHHGPFGAFRASGRSIDFTGTATALVNDGQIVELWVNGDLLGLLQQLGAVIAPPTEGA